MDVSDSRYTARGSVPQLRYSVIGHRKIMHRCCWNGSETRQKHCLDIETCRQRKDGRETKTCVKCKVPFQKSKKKMLKSSTVTISASAQSNAGNPVALDSRLRGFPKNVVVIALVAVYLIYYPRCQVILFWSAFLILGVPCCVYALVMRGAVQQLRCSIEQWCMLQYVPYRRQLQQHLLRRGEICQRGAKLGWHQGGRS